MVNKLRGYAAAAGGGLALFGLWAAVTYADRPGDVVPFVSAAVVAVGIAASPLALAYGKLAVERRRHHGLGGVTYVSDPLEVDRDGFVRETLSHFADHSAFVDVRTRAFPEGTGIVVDHTAFHGTFVRLTRAGRLVVTGVTVEATEAVVTVLEYGWSTTMRPSASNPFLGPIPVRGAPRVMLSLGITALIVADVLFVAGAAYPAPVYNPGEKAALVGIDLYTDVDPRISETDGRLVKARFLVSVVRERAVEIQWAANASDDGPPPGGSAEQIAVDVRRLLEEARADGPDAAQRERIETLERDLESALAAVHAARERAAATASGTPATATGPTTAAGGTTPTL